MEKNQAGLEPGSIGLEESDLELGIGLEESDLN